MNGLHISQQGRAEIRAAFEVPETPKPGISGIFGRSKNLMNDMCGRSRAFESTERTQSSRFVSLYDPVFKNSKGNRKRMNGKEKQKTKKIGLNRNDSSRYLAAGEGFEEKGRSALNFFICKSK